MGQEAQEAEVSTWQGTCIVDQDVEGAPLAQVVCRKGADAVGVGKGHQRAKHHICLRARLPAGVPAWAGRGR